jgi:type II secretory ATPase GspE/PulE/Tfp pilus assembly ATPase PilB-like protein
MRTLLDDGWRLVCAGITTPAEVLRVSKDEDASFAME